MRGNVLERVTIVTVRRIRRRRHWPKALLAQVLGCSRQAVYNHFPGSGLVDSADILEAIHQAKATSGASGDAAQPGRPGARHGAGRSRERSGGRR